MFSRLPTRSSSKRAQKNKVEQLVADEIGELDWEATVYVLRCTSPENTNEVLNLRRDAGQDEKLDSRDKRAIVATRVYYVGWTNKPVDRLLSHIRATSDGAWFTSRYEPTHLEEIRVYNSKDAAKRAESTVEKEYDDFNKSGIEDLFQTNGGAKQKLSCDTIIEQIQSSSHPYAFAHSF